MLLLWHVVLDTLGLSSLLPAERELLFAFTYIIYLKEVLPKGCCEVEALPSEEIRENVSKVK